MDKILDVKIDSNKIASDDYVLNGNTITINNLSALYSGEQVSIEMIAKSFTLNQTKDKIISIAEAAKRAGMTEAQFSSML